MDIAASGGESRYRRERSLSRVTKASDLLVAALENEGVGYIFAIPGEENLDVLESLRRSKIKLVLTRHEQAAGFMAATYGRLTGRAGVCLTTLGPGALNLTTAAAYAHLGAMPMVMTVDRSDAGRRRASRSSHGRCAAHQDGDAGRRRRRVCRSRPSEAQQSGRAPCISNCEDIAAAKPRRDHSPDHSSTLRRPVIERAASYRPAARLCRRRAAASRRAAVGVRPMRIPFFNTQMGKAVNAGSNLYMGTAALSERDWVHEAIDQADLIISIGHDTVEKPPFLMGHDGPQVIHVGATPATVEQVYFPQAEIVGDVGASLTSLADRLEGKLPNGQALLGLREGILARLAERSTEDRFPLTPQRIVHDVRQVIPPDGIVALDNGMYKIWFARNYRTSVANTLLLDNALATMGAGLPSAIAAALIHPDRRVLAVCGDGGFMMNSQELETAVRLKLNLVVLVLEDRAYGMIRWKQEVDTFPNFGLEFGNPDFVAYAKSYGAKGWRVGKASELSTMLEAAFGEGGVHLVVVPVDYSENMRVLVKELPPVVQAK